MAVYYARNNGLNGPLDILGRLVNSMGFYGANQGQGLNYDRGMLAPEVQWPNYSSPVNDIPLNAPEASPVNDIPLNALEASPVNDIPLNAANLKPSSKDLFSGDNTGETYEQWYRRIKQAYKNNEPGYPTSEEAHQWFDNLRQDMKNNPSNYKSLDEANAWLTGARFVNGILPRDGGYIY